jgi:hypothetical protein
MRTHSLRHRPRRQGRLSRADSRPCRDLKRIGAACREGFCGGGEEVKCLPTYLMVGSHALLSGGEGETHSAGRF